MFGRFLNAGGALARALSAPLTRLGRLGAGALLIAVLAACESPIHTRTPLVPTNDLEVSRGLVGTYALPFEEGADTGVALRIWPEADGEHLFEWYLRTPDGGALNSLMFHTRMKAAALDDGRLLVEVSWLGANHYPRVVKTASDGLLFEAIEMDRTAQISVAEGLGLTLHRSGQLDTGSREAVLGLLAALRQDTELLPAVSIEEFEAAVDSSRRHYVRSLYHASRMVDALVEPGRRAPSGPADPLELREMARQGDGWAAYSLALLNMWRIIDHDEVEARALAAAALEAGEERAAGIVGNLDLRSSETDEERAAALDLIRRGMGADDPYALRIAALSGIQTEGFTSRVSDYMHRAAGAGDPVTSAILGERYFRGQGVEQDDARALEYLRAAADAGYEEAAFRAGLMLHLAAGAPEDQAEAAKYVTLAARLRHAEAQEHLGRFYRDGIGVAQDADRAIHWYRLAADAERTNAMYGLGHLLQESDDEEARAEAPGWLRRSAEEGHAGGQYLTGLLYLTGDGVEEDASEASVWLREAAEQGIAAAKVRLGAMHADGRGVPQDDAEAAAWFRRAAQAGYSEGQYLLGMVHELGRGVPRDVEEAADWYRRAAEQGNAEAQSALSAMQTRGRAMAQAEEDEEDAGSSFSPEELVANLRRQNRERLDRDRARQAEQEAQLRALQEEYRRLEEEHARETEGLQQALDELDAIDQEIGVGEQQIAAIDQEIAAIRSMAATCERLLLTPFDQLDGARTVSACNAAIERGMTSPEMETSLGRGYDRLGEHAEAVRWYRRAAEQGYARAQANLAWMYREGSGIQRDYSEAVAWYRRAAEQGHANAQSNLGTMYDLGQGVARDYRRAVEWYRKAADQGDAHAQNNLGTMYADGTGVQRNLAQAAYWFRRAAEQGDASAQQNLRELERIGSARPGAPAGTPGFGLHDDPVIDGVLMDGWMN